MATRVSNILERQQWSASEVARFERTLKRILDPKCQERVLLVLRGCGPTGKSMWTRAITQHPRFASSKVVTVSCDSDSDHCDLMKTKGADVLVCHGVLEKDKVLTSYFRELVSGKQAWNLSSQNEAPVLLPRVVIVNTNATTPILIDTDERDFVFDVPFLPPDADVSALSRYIEALAAIDTTIDA